MVPNFNTAAERGPFRWNKETFDPNGMGSGLNRYGSGTTTSTDGKSNNQASGSKAVEANRKPVSESADGTDEGRATEADSAADDTHSDRTDDSAEEDSGDADDANEVEEEGEAGEDEDEDDDEDGDEEEEEAGQGEEDDEDEADGASSNSSGRIATAGWVVRVPSTT